MYVVKVWNGWAVKQGKSIIAIYLTEADAYRHIELMKG